MKKNVASQIVGAQMTTAADGTDFTGTVTCYYTLDGGTQTIGSVGSGVCTHEGKGYHTYAPAQAETNGDIASFSFSGTGAVTVSVHIYTSFPQTVDIPTLLPAALVGGKMDANVGAISTSTTAADNLEASALGLITGAAVAGTLSTTVMTSDVTGYADNELIGRVIVWTGGTAAGQASNITDYASANGTFTYTTITTLPVSGDTFVVV